jgi:hypothetical protein
MIVPFRKAEFKIKINKTTNFILGDTNTRNREVVIHTTGQIFSMTLFGTEIIIITFGYTTQF